MNPEQKKQPSATPVDLGLAREAARGSPHPPQVPPGEEPTLARYVWTILEGWTLVATIFLFVLAAGAFYFFAATPIYHSDVVVQVEQKNKGLAVLDDLLASGATPAETEMAIIRSRSSLDHVVDELALDLDVAARRFPVIGGAMARRYKGAGPAPLRFGPASFGWGGERLKIRRLDVPDELLDRPLQLTALPGGGFRLTDPDDQTIVEGEAGKLASAPYGERTVEIFVADLLARPGTQFDVMRRRRSDVVTGLQKKLRVAEDGKLSGILVISLDGADPARTAAVLDAVANNYVRQNVERKSADTAQQLTFLESQLPIVKANVGEAEAALNKFLATHGSVNLSNDAQAVLARGVEVEKELTSLELQRSELNQRFTASHPTLASLNEKMAMLRNERATLNAKMKQMPEAEADSARLQRDLRVSNELYNVLLNKTQELRIVKSGTVGNVRILDPAVVSARPAWPRAGAVLALSSLLGVLAGIGGAFARKALAQGVEDADEIESGTGLAVYATVPHSETEDALVRGRRAGTTRQTVLAAIDPQDIAVENLRSLRTSLQFALVEARNNIITLSGPAPEVGKSFVSVNLAYVLATNDRRVLVIDADLRRGRIHRFFGLGRRPGLSDVLGGAVALGDAIRRTSDGGVDVLPTGSVPPNAAELLASRHFQALLEKVSHSYAYVVIDTPPALAVADATIVAPLAGVNLLVLKAGKHSMREIAACVKRFTQAGSTVQGAVLNDIRTTAGRYGRHGRYQRYEYRSDLA